MLRRRARAGLVALGLIALAGCATPTGAARSALVQGRYDEAATRFQELLAEDPGRLDALIGLGVAKYKLNAFADAVGLLERATAQAPGFGSARLYLGLTHLRLGNVLQAREHLEAYRALDVHPRARHAVDRALSFLDEESASDTVRGFVAAGLEDDVEWVREIPEREAAARAYADPLSRFPYGGLGPCLVMRRGRLLCY